MSQRPGRSWGFWTELKLEILQSYLHQFLHASKNKASEFVYLDAFAGEGHGISRLTGDRFPGSARIALEVDIAGGFTKLRYFEQAGKAKELEDRLRTDYPGRDIKVHGGDCNDTIASALDELRLVRWAPTFAFLDPDGMELSWGTLARLAGHKVGYKKSGPEYKVELWLLFPTQGLIRTLALDDVALLPGHEQGATRVFGTESWRAIYQRRRAHDLTAREAKEEYVNLMRWRLVHELGYAKTHPFELKNSQGGTLYHMIFATDNPAGDRIMAGIYSTAASKMPAMQREARDRKSGQMALGIDDSSLESASYQHEPPRDPASRS
jgi:three-Cys-motif partner protein